MKHVLVAVVCAVGALLVSAGEARASCSAQVICEVTVIQCNGQSVCHSGSNWVQCDSQATIYCPVCQAQVTCCDGRFLYCNGYSSCEEYEDHIVCDGHTRGFCPDCPNWGSTGPGFFREEPTTSNSAEPLFQVLSQPGA